MRTIDKDALLSDIERTIVESGCVNHEGEIMDCVRYAPTIEAVPVVHGEWIFVGYGKPDAWDCSECNAMVGRKYNFCPNCGSYNGGDKA